jgi:LPXTG-site transpeptidase (sortase) family protein
LYEGKKQHRSKRTLFVVAIAGVVLSLVLVFGVSRKIPIVGAVVPLFGQKEVSAELPVRLVIPKISVDAAIEYVGVAPDGSMDVPKGPDDVAWFQFGPRPGEVGSAVIAGHYGWKDNRPAAFDQISTLQKGDTLSVQDEKGETITFVVRETRLFDPKADSSSVFNSNDGKAHLNLITCEGVWDAASKSYSKRLIVFTDKE